MKTFCRCLFFVVVVMIFVSNSGFTKKDTMADPLKGAWMHQNGDEEQLLLLVDGYATHTVYSRPGKKFVETCGGTYVINGNNLEIRYEFHTRDKEQIGQSLPYSFSVKNDVLTIDANGKKVGYKRIDDGSAPLTGLWHITSRMQDGKLAAIHRSGTRKTIKILSGSRFQWAAIDPGTKEFLGSGGGSYVFANGKYTEHIEFFSRDSSRVGASLSFDGKLENGQWHHSGLSSRGDKIYEIWSRVNN